MSWLMTFPEDRPSIPVYRNWLRSAGIESILVTPNDPLPDLKAVEALLLPGGGDVDPARYGQARHPDTYGVKPDQDAMEVDLIQRFLALRKPIFGICRGLQVLNVALGGTLIQHVPDVVSDDTERHRQEKSYDSMHALRVTGQSPFSRSLEGATEVNSAHHQAIDPAAVAPSLRVVATSGQGIIEAVEGVGLPSTVCAVQWHPERLPANHPGSAFLTTCWMKHV